MPEQFFQNLILNSPYAIPSKHWELNQDGQPTNKLIPKRRSAKFVTPIPKPKKRQAQGTLFADQDLSTDSQQYEC
jgi:type III restriction enzyme